MAMDEVNRRPGQGPDFGMRHAAGRLFPAKVVVVWSHESPGQPRNGVVSDAAMFMIELLGDETTIELSLDQFGKGFGEVIVRDRNQSSMILNAHRARAECEISCDSHAQPTCPTCPRS
jgi:hypothetical protein